MKKDKILYYGFISIIFLSCFSSMPNAQGASSYDFDIDRMQVDVFIELDGSITMKYWINFTNNNWQNLDVFDIGMPNKHYDLDSVNATLTDNSGIHILNPQKSEYIDIGVEIWLTGHYVSQSESAMLYVEANNPKMTFTDYENQSMASVEFSPTWFDSSFCSQYDELEVNMYFPPNSTNGNLVKYHYDEYNDYKVDELVGSNYYLVYTWNGTNVPMQQQKYGVSFPGDWTDAKLSWTANPRLIKSIVNAILIISILGLIIGTIYFIVRYFKVTKKKYYPPKKIYSRSSDAVTSLCCFMMIGGIFVFMYYDMYPDIVSVILFFALILSGFGMIGYMLYSLINKIKRPYSKPEIMVESVGVKKGLSVIEAAIIKNTSLNRVVFLMIFSLVRTNHIKITDTDPVLKLEVLTEESLENLRWYQQELIKTIITRGPRSGEIKESELKTLMIKFIKRTHARMKGHDLKATNLYYENMIKQAWVTVEKLPEEIDWKDIEREYEWLILDNDFEERSQRVFSRRYYRTNPYWYSNYYYYNRYWHSGYYYRYYPRYSNYSHGGSLPSRPIQSPRTHVNMASFSDSIVRGIESFSNDVVTNFSTMAEKIVDKVRPVAKKTSTGSSGGRSYSGGGGGCACACACAGCACACAGGGR